MSLVLAASFAVVGFSACKKKMDSSIYGTWKLIRYERYSEFTGELEEKIENPNIADLDMFTTLVIKKNNTISGSASFEECDFSDEFSMKKEGDHYVCESTSSSMYFIIYHKGKTMVVKFHEGDNQIYTFKKVK